MYRKIKDYLNNVLRRDESQETKITESSSFSLPKSIYKSFISHASKLKKILTPKIK